MWLKMQMVFFFFRFSSPELMNLYLQKGPWALAGKPIFLKHWSPGSPVSKEKHESFPIWIPLLNVPVEYWSPIGLSWIAISVGKPLLLHPHNAKLERLQSTRVSVEVGIGSILPSKIRLCSGSPAELEHMPEAEVQVEYQRKLERCRLCHKIGHRAAQCSTKSILQPMACTLLGSVSELEIAAQPYSMPDSAPPVTVSNQFESLALNEVAPAPFVQVPCLVRSELGPATDGDCNEAPVGITKNKKEAPAGRVALAADLLPQNKAQNVSVVLEAGSDLVMPGSFRSASVALFDEAPKSVSHCRLMPPCSGCSHPVVVVGKEYDAPFPFPAPYTLSSPLNTLHQIKHPADAVFDESSSAVSSPSQHAALAYQHGKSPSSAQLALVCHQERHPASFAEVLRCGLVVATAEDLLGAGADSISMRPITDADRMDALGTKATSNMRERIISKNSLFQFVLLQPWMLSLLACQQKLRLKMILLLILHTALMRPSMSIMLWFKP